MSKPNIVCPICSNSEFNETWAEKNVFLCDHKNEDGQVCMGSVIYCKYCDKQYPESNFGKHGDVYECKECGNVHWGFTDLMNYREETRGMMFSEFAKLRSVENKINNL